MKFVKKGIITLLVMGMMSLSFSQNVQACDKTADCYATGTTSTCGYVRGQEGHHTVTEPNGYTSNCKITVVSGPHTIKCAGCGAALYSEFRTCSETHSNQHCYTKKNLCKY